MSAIRTRVKLIATAAALLVCSATSAAWWALSGAKAPATSATVASASAQDRRQSIIILPFANAGGDPAQDGLAAHMTSAITDIIAADGDFPASPKISAAAYLGRAADPATIGRQYGVHFVLIGNARRQDGRLVVSAVLHETADGQVVWSTHLDRQDSPDGERYIAQSIYEGVWQASIDEETAHAAREHPNNLDKRDLVMIAQSTWLSTSTKEHLQEQMALIDRALIIDPNYYRALERQARIRSAIVMQGYSSDPTADLAIADNAANHALLVQPNSRNSLRAKEFVLRAQGRWPEAEAVLRRLIGMEPTEANHHWDLGQVLMAEGRNAEALASFEAAKRLAGGADPIFLYDAYIAMAELGNGQLVKATAAARLSLSEFPPDIGVGSEIPWLALIAAESVSGKDAAARADLKSFLATSGNWRNMAEIEKDQRLAANPRLLDGLRRAGMPRN